MANKNASVVEYLVEEIGVSCLESGLGGKKWLSGGPLPPIWISLRHNDFATFQVLLEKKWDWDFGNGVNLLMQMAFERVSVEFFEYLFVRTKIDVNAVAANGWTVLHYAAKYSNGEVVSCLVKHGAVVSGNSTAASPLSLAERRHDRGNSDS